MKKNDFVFNGYYVMFAVFGLHVDHLVMLLLTLMTAETHRMLSVNWMVCLEELCCWNVIELKSKLNVHRYVYLQHSSYLLMYYCFSPMFFPVDMLKGFPQLAS